MNIKIPGFHRRRILALIALVILGVWMEWMRVEQGSLPPVKGEDPLAGGGSHRSELSGSQSGITLLVGPPIGDLWMEKAYQTRDRLWGAVYAISDRDAQAQLASKARDGTDVRIMLEQKPFSYTNNTYNTIDEIARVHSGFQLQSDEILDLKYLHSKYFLFDDSAIIQTSNLTRSGLYRNLEHSVHITDPSVIQSLEYLFETDRKGETIDMSQIHPRLVICPHNCRAVIEQMISSAKHSIDIMTQYIYDDRLISLLKKTKPDTKLRLLLSDSSGNVDLVNYFGHDTAQMYTSKKSYLHTKTILIDDHWLLVGSMNLSSNSLNNNRELGIIITDPTQIEVFKRGFERYWDKYAGVVKSSAK